MSTPEQRRAADELTEMAEAMGLYDDMPPVIHGPNGEAYAAVTAVMRSACPSCGAVATRTPYDIGSGPELSCVECEWCWGVIGQDLKPVHWQGRPLEGPW